MSSKESSLKGDLDRSSSTAPPAPYRPVAEERREASRFKREVDSDFAVIWQDADEQLLVEVHDESLFGLGVYVDSTLGLEVGSKLNVIYAGEYMEGEVRQIRPEGSRLRIGLHCRRILND